MKQQLELENEQWKTVSGYENYEVSNFGRIKSLNYKCTNQEQILKQSTNKKGYQLVGLSKDKKQKWFFVHRLVASAFIDNPNNMPQVNHIDECKTNNHVSNLEWCDCKYNNNYGNRNEKTSKSLSGENNPRSKQVIQLTIDNEVIRKWNSIHDVQRELGYSQGNISECCRGKRKSAYKYKWAYA